MSGFVPGELPFIIRLSFIENYLYNKALIQCVAVILSNYDLLINSKCLR